MQILILAFLFFFSPRSYASSEDCSKLSIVEEDKLCHEKDFENEKALFSCLNDYAKSVLRKGGVLDCQFKTGKRDFLNKNDIDPEQYESVYKDNYTPLNEAFRIFIPEERRDRYWCIEKSHLNSSSIEELEKQIESIAFFLKDYHIRALGKKASVLFTITELELCDYDREPILHYELGTLSMDIKPQEGSTTFPSPQEDSFHLYNSENIWELWNEAQHYKLNLDIPEEDKAWFHFEINLLPEAFTRMADKVEYLASLPLSKQTNYLFYKSWEIINPVGRFRTKIRVSLARKGLEKREEISSILSQATTVKSLFTYLSPKFQELGLDTEKIEQELNKLSESQKVKLRTVFEEKLSSVADQERYIQCSLSSSMEEEKAEKTNVIRELDGNVVVTNAHFIDVRLSLGNYFKRDDCINLNEYVSSSEAEAKEKTRNIHHKIRGIVIVDTLDEIEVDLSMASQIADKIPLELNAFVEALQEVKKN